MALRLLTRHHGTALGEAGRYFSTDDGVSLLSGPPIHVRRFGLDRDYPSWEDVDPRQVFFDIAEFRKGLAMDLRSHRVSSRRAVVEEDRRCRDDRWLASIIGSRLLKAAPAGQQTFPANLGCSACA